MKNTFLKRLIILSVFTITILLLMSTKVNAASLSISTSKSSVSPGETFTVTVTLSNGAGSVSSGGQTQWLDNSSFSYTKTAPSSGSISITASGTVADYTTEKDQSVSASKTVTVVVPSSGGSSSSGGGSSSGGSSSSSGNSGGRSSSTNTNRTTKEEPKEEEKSSVNTLSELVVEGQELLPAFEIDVREYKINVTNEVNEINVTATPTDSNATVEIEGNKELKEGENIVKITVTAEDESTAEYIIKVIKSREPLTLKSLKLKYVYNDGVEIEFPLNPEFDPETLEYTIKDIENWIQKITVDVEANLKDAKIEINGADELKTGENIITITLTIKESEEDLQEKEEPKEEKIEYKIKVNKLPEPSFMEKVKNKMKGIFGGIFTWYNNNRQKIIVYSLIVCVIALIGLSIYIVVDYKKYKKLVDKLRQLEQINSLEPEKQTQIDSGLQISEDGNLTTKKGGKHF